MDYEITITVDMNDADYNTRVSKIADDELEKIKPLIAAIKAFKPYTVIGGSYGRSWTHSHNYPCGEYAPRTDLGEKDPEEIYPDFDAETHEALRVLCPLRRTRFSFNREHRSHALRREDSIAVGATHATGL